MITNQKMKMNLETRKFLEELINKGKQNNITVLITPSEVYLTEQVLMRYYTSVVSKHIISHIPIKSSSKHYTMKYWLPIIEKYFKNKSVIRNNDIIVDDTKIQSFVDITEYLISDYGLSISEEIFYIIKEYHHTWILEAIKVAKNNGVFNTKYLSAVLRSKKAEIDMKNRSIAHIRQNIDGAINKIQNKEKVHNTPIDMAIAQYSWQQQLENAKLEAKLKGMVGN